MIPHFAQSPYYPTFDEILRKVSEVVRLPNFVCAVVIFVSQEVVQHPPRRLGGGKLLLFKLAVIAVGGPRVPGVVLPPLRRVGLDARPDPAHRGKRRGGLGRGDSDLVVVFLVVEALVEGLRGEQGVDVRASSSQVLNGVELGQHVVLAAKLVDVHHLILVNRNGADPHLLWIPVDPLHRISDPAGEEVVQVHVLVGDLLPGLVPFLHSPARELVELAVFLGPFDKDSLDVLMVEVLDLDVHRAGETQPAIA
mmetsp:Transcript_6267/g.15109  ORF Transcript_6267/g.15109 Transcript_6267/m.15109 type:complete len:252 (+) Transcript_6267:1022-1777(+)